MSEIVPILSGVSAEERAVRSCHAGAILWFTGLPGSGKSTLAYAIERRLFNYGGIPVLLDGDTLRFGLNADLDFSSPADRSENVRRLAEVAAHLARNGFIAIVATVSERSTDRAQARQIGGPRFYEIHVAASSEVCERRDPKGLYRQARAGKITGFTGSGTAYEPPSAPDLKIDTERFDIDASARQIEDLLKTAGVLWNGTRQRGGDLVI